MHQHQESTIVVGGGSDTGPCDHHGDAAGAGSQFDRDAADRGRPRGAHRCYPPTSARMRSAGSSAASACALAIAAPNPPDTSTSALPSSCCSASSARADIFGALPARSRLALISFCVLAWKRLILAACAVTSAVNEDRRASASSPLAWLTQVGSCSTGSAAGLSTSACCASRRP